MVAEPFTYDVIFAPGRIVVDPLNLSDPYPHGGAEVGLTNGCVVEPRGRPFRIMSEGLGEATDILEPGSEQVCSLLLRGWNDEAVARVLPAQSALGSTTRHRMWLGSGGRTPGQSMLKHSVVLLFVPDDVVNVPGFLLYRAVPTWAEGAQVAFQRAEELGLPVAFACMRDTSDRVLAVGRVPDLRL